MKASGEEPLLPDNPVPYLTDLLFEIGPADVGGMGEAPMALRHITADLASICVEADLWEIRTLRRLSAAWTHEKYHARKRDRPAPYSGPEGQPEVSQDKLTGQFAALWNSFKSRINR